MLLRDIREILSTCNHRKSLLSFYKSLNTVVAQPQVLWIHGFRTFKDGIATIMPFPFFRLPLELRTMVYEEVFQTPSRDGIINPDPFYWRRRSGRFFGNRTVNNGLGLILSCHQAHDEAVPVLYGNRVFYFDDDHRGYQASGISNIEICHTPYAVLSR